jgi:hypothetical protein
LTDAEYDQNPYFMRGNGASLASAPAFAADAGNRDLVYAPQTVPDILSSKQKQLYTQVLTAIRGQRWADAKSLLDGADNGPLTDFLRAELLTAANSPRAEISDILPILSRSPFPAASRTARPAGDAARRDRAADASASGAPRMGRQRSAPPDRRCSEQRSRRSEPCAHDSRAHQE